MYNNSNLIYIQYIQGRSSLGWGNSWKVVIPTNKENICEEKLVKKLDRIDEKHNYSSMPSIEATRDIYTTKEVEHFFFT